jgi:hypothetical protein
MSKAVTAKALATAAVAATAGLAATPASAASQSPASTTAARPQGFVPRPSSASAGTGKPHSWSFQVREYFPDGSSAIPIMIPLYVV